MAGVKRQAEVTSDRNGKRLKQKKSLYGPTKASKAPPKVQTRTVVKEPSASDSDSSDDFGGFSDDSSEVEEENGQQIVGKSLSSGSKPKENHSQHSQISEAAAGAGNGSSKESHAKQKALSIERKSSKPNADSIARAKKIWERMRRKSHVPAEERTKLLDELFSIITGRVKDFVFKHDAVRAIQTAVRYASLERRKQIARELKGDYRTLAESKYAKFLVGKLIVNGDNEIRDLIVPEFYGHIRRLMRHPEASWIVDDIYRTVATPTQKAIFLREWYGPEFALFKPSPDSQPVSELSTILKDYPEKRTPIMRYLLESINQLVQKKTTGFTMLHDAMLQYFLNTQAPSSSSTEFLELLKGDDDGDLLKNLAFTASGARLVCLALGYGNAKDRKLILRAYKDVIRLLSEDVHGHMVLLAAYDVIDDTVMTAKSIFPELVPKADSAGTEEQAEDLIARLNTPISRVPLLYLFSTNIPKYLPKITTTLLETLHTIRTETSKKEAQLRRRELLTALAPPLLDLIASHPADLVKSSFGAQCITDVLLCAQVTADKTVALTAVADLASMPAVRENLESPSTSRMLKTLVQGGWYNPATRKPEMVDPPLDFHNLLHTRIKGEVGAWATGSNSFVIVAMLEAQGFEHKEKVLSSLAKKKDELRAALGEGNKGAGLLLGMVD